MKTYLICIVALTVFAQTGAAQDLLGPVAVQSKTAQKPFVSQSVSGGLYDVFEAGTAGLVVTSALSSGTVFLGALASDVQHGTTTTTTRGFKR